MQSFLSFRRQGSSLVLSIAGTGHADSQRRRFGWATTVIIALVASIGLATPSHAITGTVRVTVAKAGFVVGAGGGRGVLTFRHRNYPFTVQGLSVGLTAGASVSKLVGRAKYMRDVSDFSGIYSVIGAGAALV